MKPPLARLKQLAALLVAGVLGSSYATCYWQTQTTCATDGTTVDNLTFPGWNGGSSTAIKANGNWGVLHYTNKNLGGYGRQGLTTQKVCAGPAKFTNPKTSANETIGWWKAGTVDTSLRQNFRWQTTKSDSSTC